MQYAFFTQLLTTQSMIHPYIIYILSMTHSVFIPYFLPVHPAAPANSPQQLFFKYFSGGFSILDRFIKALLEPQSKRKQYKDNYLILLLIKYDFLMIC